MKKRKTISISLSEETIKAIEELSKEHELKKSQVIEKILKNVIDTELEKILIIDNMKLLLPQIINIDNIKLLLPQIANVSPNINLPINTPTKTEIQKTTQKPEKEEKIQKEEKQPEETTEKKNKEETKIKKIDDSFWEFNLDDVL
mgnify:FL=1